MLLQTHKKPGAPFRQIILSAQTDWRVAKTADAMFRSDFQL